MSSTGSSEVMKSTLREAIPKRSLEKLALFRYIPSMELAHPHDSAYKYLFKNKRIFLQLLQSFVPEDFVQNLTVDDLDTVSESYISEEFINRESDLIYKVKQGNRELYFYILIEFQSKPDKTMAA